MKKLLLIAIVALIGLAACTTSHQKNVKEDVALDTASVLQRVEEIYAKVFDAYNNNPITAIPHKDLDTLYCSRDWNQTMHDVIEHDTKLSGQMGFFEADYWIMGQDWQDLAISDVRVFAMSDSTATVDLNLHNCGHVKPVRLEMAREAGVWKIDDFIDVNATFDWKAGMKQYLADNQ